jgi:hypothetical protein
MFKKITLLARGAKCGGLGANGLGGLYAGGSRGAQIQTASAEEAPSIDDLCSVVIHESQLVEGTFRVNVEGEVRLPPANSNIGSVCYIPTELVSVVYCLTATSTARQRSNPTELASVVAARVLREAKLRRASITVRQ